MKKYIALIAVTLCLCCLDKVTAQQPTTQSEAASRPAKKEFKMPPRLSDDQVAAMETIKLTGEIKLDELQLRWTPPNPLPCDGVVVVIATDNANPMPPQDGYIEWYAGIGNAKGNLPLAKIALGKKVYLRVCFADVDDPPRVTAVSNVIEFGPITKAQAREAHKKAMLVTCPICYKPKYACECGKAKPLVLTCKKCGKPVDECTCKPMSQRKCPICKKTLDECSCKVAGRDRELCEKCGKVKEKCECEKAMKAKCSICGKPKDQCTCKPADDKPTQSTEFTVSPLKSSQ